MNEKNQLWIVVKEEGLKSYDELTSAIKPIENMAKYIVNGVLLFCLQYNPKGDPKGEDKENPIWSIERANNTSVAQAFIELNQ